MSTDNAVRNKIDPLTDPTAFLRDLIKAFDGKSCTKHNLVNALEDRYEIDLRSINRWLYKYEDRFFEKDRSQQHGLPNWVVIASPLTKQGDEHVG
jgi:hypothetical protein